MIRKMMHFRKADTESLVPFMERSEKSITNIMQMHSVLSWDTLARRNVFKWAGWVARLQIHDPLRITLDILRHRNWNWICSIADENRGRQLHGRYLHTWRWEKLVYNFFDNNFPGQDWFTVAQDVNAWMGIVDSVG